MHAERARKPTCNQFVAIHLQILLHPAEEGIVDIGLVEILEEVADGREGEDEGINLEEKPALVLWEFPRVPDVTFPCLDGLGRSCVR